MVKVFTHLFYTGPHPPPPHPPQPGTARKYYTDNAIPLQVTPKICHREGRAPKQVRKEGGKQQKAQNDKNTLQVQKYYKIGVKNPDYEF